MDNKEILACFRQPMEKDRWCFSIKNYVANWVKTHNKQYWSLVLFVSKREGILKPSLGRKKFGELLLALVPEVMDKNDTPLSLKASMDKFEYNDQLDCFNRLEDDDILKVYVKELTELFNKHTETESCEEESPSMAQLMKKYLDECVNTTHYANVVVSPTYCNFTATLSVEQFKSKKFMDECHPSYIEVYECVDEIVNEAKVFQLAGIYMGDKRIKLYIVSTHGYDNHTINVARERNVGLIRINMNKTINENNFVLPRLSDPHLIRSSYLRMLTDEQPMTEPIIIMDFLYITTSLSDILKHDHIEIRTDTLIEAPVLSNNEIEEISYQMVKPYADQYAMTLKNIDYTSDTIPYYNFDVYGLISSQGVTIKRDFLLPQTKLGVIDIEHKTLFLNPFVGNQQRERFTVAHDGGHFRLHSHLGIPQFTEINTSMRPMGTADQYRLEWQANHFASCLLMPTNVVRELYRIYWQKEYGPFYPEPLMFTNNTFVNDFVNEYRRVVAPISRKLDVSMEAMKWRLHKLNLLQTDDDTKLKDLK